MIHAFGLVSSKPVLYVYINKDVRVVLMVPWVTGCFLPALLTLKLTRDNVAFLKTEKYYLSFTSVKVQVEHEQLISVFEGKQMRLIIPACSYFC